MGKIKNLAGTKIGRLLPISLTGGKTKSNSVIWNCLCDCGTHVTVASTNLHIGGTESCGCFHKEQASTANKKHGMFGTRTYQTWASMIQRCTNPKLPNWSDYGGRGIQVCKEWLDFENFYADMGDRPDGLTLDRIDNNSGYSKANCRWATRKEQATNRRNVQLIAHEGQSLCQADFAKVLGEKKTNVHRWLAQGLSVSQIKNLGGKRKGGMYLEHDGKSMTAPQWAKHIGVPYQRLFYWLKSGMSIEYCIANAGKRKNAVNNSPFYTV